MSPVVSSFDCLFNLPVLTRPRFLVADFFVCLAILCVPPLRSFTDVLSQSDLGTHCPSMFKQRTLFVSADESFERAETLLHHDAFFGVGYEARALIRTDGHH